MVNGNEGNPAIFWPEFWRCDRERLGVKEATLVSAVTILMGAKINCWGVGGLEIWQYEKRWKPIQKGEIDSITDYCEDFYRIVQRHLFTDHFSRKDSSLRSMLSSLLRR